MNVNVLDDLKTITSLIDIVVSNAESLMAFLVVAAIIAPLTSLMSVDMIHGACTTKKEVKATIMTFFIWILLIIVFLIANFEGEEILLAIKHVSIVCGIGAIIICATIWYANSRVKM